MSEAVKKRVTLGKPASAELTEKKSVFIASVSPVESEQEAIDFIASVKKKYSDARHNVYAYQLDNGRIARYSDDGEPQGTAGVPVLDIINKGGFTDAVIVVTRYFGGILLGAGGLVRAYSGAARLGVEAAGIVTYRNYIELSIDCSYPDYGKLTVTLSDPSLFIDSTDFRERVVISVAVPEEDCGQLEKTISEITSGRAVVTRLSSRFDRK